MAKKKIGIKIPTLKELNKSFPTSFVASERDDSNFPKIPTRFLAYNYQLGGGITFGRLMEIFGEESSGKSLAAYDFAYCTQQLGGVVLLADAEQAFTNKWAEQNGLDLDRVLILRETSVEVISDWIAQYSLYWRSILTHNEPILVIIDSLASLDTSENINSQMTDSKADMGNRAKAIYKMFRIRSELLSKLGVTMICINQLRKNLKAGMFQNPDTTPGGQAMKFYASIRSGFYGSKTITEKHKGKEVKVGRYTSIRMEKNKIAPSRATISKAPMYYNPKYHDVGFDRYFGLGDILVEE